MKKNILTAVLLASFLSYAISQNLTQTLRGTLVDTDSKLPLIGASVIISGSNPILGTVTDLDGNFKFENIPIGRITLKLSYLGYENTSIPNIELNSGKETVLELNIRESVIKMDEIVIKPKRKNGEPLNDMALISARSISPELTTNYPGTFNDPSVILSNFAGITNTGEGSNEIIVRGNSPKYLQWRLEGVEISTPNHFADQGYTMGGFSALNNNILATSDFYSGAFSAEYGNALSGVYDVKIREGNNEKFESTFGIGILGTDFTVEGPFKKDYAGSYLLNYRYSTIALISKAGLLSDVPDGLNFQDFTVKFVLPTKKIGTFSLYAFGGLSGFTYDDVKGDMLPTPGDNGMNPNIVEDFYKDNYLLNTGITHSIAVNKTSYIKTTLAYSADGINNDIFQSGIRKTDDGQGGVIVDTVNRTLNYKSTLDKSAYRGMVSYNNKINAKNKIQIGTKYTLFSFINNQSMLNEDYTARVTVIDGNENVAVLGNFISWKYRLNDAITLVSGIHNMNVLYNNKSTIEPRIALNWDVNKTNSIHLGYGKHSNMEDLQNYFIKIPLEDGTVIEPNKDLDLLKADHYVVGYKKQITENLVANIELYYQHLYNLPVENNDTSYYSTLNSNDEFRYVDLVNKGTGKNYGAEITLERYFAKNYYYLINASLYESKYTTLEGIERNTQNNGNYLVNVLCGKEFKNLGKKQNRTFAVNGKIFYGGGKKIIPLQRDSQGNLAVDPANNQYWDYNKAYENKIEDNYKITISVSYKINKPKATHEIYVDLQNITGYKAKITEYYDEDKPGSIGYMAIPVGLFPNLMYRVYF